MVKVGIIGIGGMGRMHFNCYKNNPDAQVVAICDIDKRKLEGDWSSIGLNIDTSKSDVVDLAGINTYESFSDLIADPAVAIVDICLPTPLHTEVTIAALQAGKHVLCEKPMAMSVAECDAIVEAAAAAPGQLMIGHCLRYWPQYVETNKIIESGKYGKPLYAKFHRSGDTPLWSSNNWLATGSQSGGAVHDMHIHDADTALWWFGEPSKIDAAGVVADDLPLSVDANWRYDSGLLVNLHGSWDNNGGAFRYAFKVVLEQASIEFDSASGNSALLLHIKNETTEIPVADELAYQNEINDFVDCVKTGRKLERVTPEASRTSVATTLEELRQVRGQ